MTAREIVNSLNRVGVELVARGTRIWFRPAKLVTGEMRDALKRQKTEVLDYLRSKQIGNRTESTAEHEFVESAQSEVCSTGRPEIRRPKSVCRKCESRDVVRIEIHAGKSTRCDCARCGAFVCFDRWYGRSDN